MVRHASACRQTRLELLGRRLRIEALFERGDLAEVRRAVDEYAGRVTLVRDPRYAFFVPLWRATLAAADGDEAGYRRERAALHTLVEVLPADSDARLLARVQELFHLLDVEERPGHRRPPLRRGDGGRPRRACRLRSPSPRRSSSPRTATPRRREPCSTAGPPRSGRWSATPSGCPRWSSSRTSPGSPVATRSPVGPTRSLLPYRDLWAVEGIGAALRGPVSRAIAALGRSIVSTCSTNGGRLGRAPPGSRSTRAPGSSTSAAPPGGSRTARACATSPGSSRAPVWPSPRSTSSASSSSSATWAPMLDDDRAHGLPPPHRRDRRSPRRRGHERGQRPTVGGPHRRTRPPGRGAVRRRGPRRAGPPHGVERGAGPHHRHHPGQGRAAPPRRRPSRGGAAPASVVADRRVLPLRPRPGRDVGGRAPARLTRNLTPWDPIPRLPVDGFPGRHP